MRDERDNAYKNIDRASEETRTVRTLLSEAENGKDGKQFEIDELRVNLDAEVNERQKLRGQIEKLKQMVESLTKRAEKQKSLETQVHMQTELIERQKQTIEELNKGKEQLIEINKELEKAMGKAPKVVRAKPTNKDGSSLRY